MCVCVCVLACVRACERASVCGCHASPTYILYRLQEEGGSGADDVAQAVWRDAMAVWQAAIDSDCRGRYGGIAGGPRGCRAVV